MPLHRAHRPVPTNVSDEIVRVPIHQFDTVDLKPGTLQRFIRDNVDALIAKAPALVQPDAHQDARSSRNCVVAVNPTTAGGCTQGYSPRNRDQRGGPTMTLPNFSAASAIRAGEISKPSGRGSARSRPAWRNMPSMPAGVLIISRSAFADVMR
jgi:hypothetical protein